MPYLDGCSKKELAFENWMKRDYLFADSVLQEALQAGYSTLIVDGTKSIFENLKAIEDVFGLAR